MNIPRSIQARAFSRAPVRQSMFPHANRDASRSLSLRFPARPAPVSQKNEHLTLRNPALVMPRA